jgi:hypothetical protein
MMSRTLSLHSGAHIGAHSLHIGAHNLHSGAHSLHSGALNLEQLALQKPGNDLLEHHSSSANIANCGHPRKLLDQRGNCVAPAHIAIAGVNK